MAPPILMVAPPINQETYLEGWFHPSLAKNVEQQCKEHLLSAYVWLWFGFIEGAFCIVAQSTYLLTSYAG